MAWLHQGVVVLAAAGALTAGCGGRALSGDAGPPSLPAISDTHAGVNDVDARVSDTGGEVAPGAVGGGLEGQELTLPPAAPSGLTFRPCGAITLLPELLGVTADGEVALLAGNQRGPAYVHLFSRDTGRVTRTVEIDDNTALLTADRRHVLTRTALFDLSSASAVRRASPGGGELAVGPAGDFVIAGHLLDPATGDLSIVKVDIATDRFQELAHPVAPRRVTAAAVTDDGLRALLLVAAPVGDSRNAVLTLEVRALADGSLERTISIDDGAIATDAGEVLPALRPALTTVGDIALVNVSFGFRAYRLGDGMRVWVTRSNITEAQLSPRPGVVAFRSSDTDPWQLRDLGAGTVVGTLDATVNRSVDQQVSVVSPAPFLSFTPDGREVVFEDDALRVGGLDGSTALLPFKRNAWAARGVFLSETEFVSIEVTGPGSFDLGVRKRALPGGEILAEMSSGESQSEWDGDIALAPDGRSIAVALPDSVHVLRASDLFETGVISRAAGRIAWSHDGAALLTTPDVHYRDLGRPPQDPAPRLEVWTRDGRLDRSYALPFIPIFGTFTEDDGFIIVTGRPAVTVVPASVSPLHEVQLSGPLQAVHVERASGAMTPAPTLLASDPSRRFGTDLETIYRIEDGARIAALDLPVGPTDSNGDGLPSVAGVTTRDHAPVFSSDGAFLADLAASGFSGYELAVYEAATGKRVQLTPPPINDGGQQVVLSFSPSGRQLATATWGSSNETLRLLCSGP
jgi:hypothetical protein